MTEKSNVIQLNNGIVRPDGTTIVTPQHRAEMFMAAYQVLCDTHKCQLQPVFIIQGNSFETRLQVEMINESENSN